MVWYVLGSSLIFGFLFLIWSRDDWFNIFLKAVFGGMCILGVRLLWFLPNSAFFGG